MSTIGEAYSKAVLENRNEKPKIVFDNKSNNVDSVLLFIIIP